MRGVLAALLLFASAGLTWGQDDDPFGSDAFGDDLFGDPSIALPTEPAAQASALETCMANPADRLACAIADDELRGGGLESAGDRLLETGILDLGDGEPTYTLNDASPSLPLFGPDEAPLGDPDAARKDDSDAPDARERPDAVQTAVAEPSAPPDPATTLVVVEADVFFELGSATLRPSEAAKVDRFAGALAGPAAQGTTFLLLGHTDSTGSEAANCRLSERRAATLVEALSARGVARDKLLPIGAGEALPRNPADTRAAENRRVAFAPLTTADFAKVARLQAICP